jgi:predicted MPP superfamily phosphohydrolase
VLVVLLAPVVPGGAATMVAAVALSFAPLVLFFRNQRSAGRYPGAAMRLLAFRPFLYLQLSLPFLAAGGLLGAIAGAPFGMAGRAGRLTLLVLTGLGALTAAAGWVGSRSLRVRHLRAEWPDLPAGLDGLRIVQLSDLHVGPQTSRPFLARVRRAVEEAKPDLVALTGDLIDDHAPDVRHFDAALGTLAAPLGVYAVAGNHDVYAQWPAVEAALALLPLTVLVNDARTVERGGSRLTIVGVGDPAGGRTRVGPDSARAMALVPAGSFPLALAHNPALWPPLADLGARLTLSGHTHWGQLAWPARDLSIASPFLGGLVMGAHQRGNSLLYITPGTGFWGLPFRLGAWPEVAVITLGRGPEARVVEAS